MYRFLLSCLLLGISVCAELSAVRHARFLSPPEAQEVWGNFLAGEVKPTQAVIRWASFPKTDKATSGSGHLNLNISTIDGIVHGQLSSMDRRKFTYQISPQNATWQEYTPDASILALENPSQPLPEFGGLSLFDFSMPFLYWEMTYLGPDRVLGRPVQRFLLRPNTSQKRQNPAVASGELALDPAWGIWLKIIYKSIGGEILRYINVLQLRKIGPSDFEETIDFITFPDRTKVRLQLQCHIDAIAPDPISSQEKAFFTIDK